MISAIVLAAGLSTRMGRPKLLLHVKGKPILQNVLEALSHAGVDEVVVVLGAEAVEIRKRVRFARERVVVNSAYAEGMSSSLKLGLMEVSSDSEAAVIVLGDQPFLSPSTVDKVVEAYRASGAPIVVPTQGGVRGNPVLFAKSLFPEVMRISGDAGGKSVVGRHRGRVLEVPVEDAGVLFDIDTPSDYDRASSGAPTRRRTQGGA